MYKALVLTALLSACTIPDSSDSASGLTCAEGDIECSHDAGTPQQPDSGGGGGGGPSCSENNPDCGDQGPTCTVNGSVVQLDQQPANVDNNDGKVTFCHATSAATNPYVVITTSTHACRAHEIHTKLPKGGFKDVFPTGGCED